MHNKNLFTSESVTEGHPDKVCDRISDAILDACLAQDPNSRVACEVMATENYILISGEITTNASVCYEWLARRTIKEIGYTAHDKGFDFDTVEIDCRIHTQSPDIAMGTNDEVGGAGDQGMMFGFACDETPDYMPLPITLANQMEYRMTQARKNGTIPNILPDGKTQVTVEYGEDGKPKRIDSIVISTQHTEDTDLEELTDLLNDEVITPVMRELPEGMAPSIMRLYVNPTGRFVHGGPAADTGLTGRKIIVDTYGGYAAHGGGAFSGKDPSKVDRSGAYMARYIAKNIVAAGLASKCQVQLAYAIGVAEPVSVRVDTYGTSTLAEAAIVDIVYKVFDMTPAGIIKTLNLRRPIYESTSAYGHMGEVIGEDRTWERLDKVFDIQKEIRNF